jgi:TolB-like protein/Tfp pilus assembly protein PilF
MGLAVGTPLGPYQILAAIGAGGMGEVYRARDTKLGRDVAIKVLSGSLAGDPERLARFDREAKILAALNHPHIVTIFSIEEAGGVPFLTMELVEGCTLGHVIGRGGVSLTQFFDISIALADALAAAHRKHLTHRDLKPANVMISDDGHVKVLDFGLARSVEAERDNADDTRLPLTKAGAIVGTLPYMSPEQIEAKPLDPRSDIFSFGVMLYEMATGERPFAGDSSPALMSSILKDHPASIGARRFDVPGGVSRLIDRCLEKHPPNRIQTATEILSELRAQRHAWESRAAAVSKPLVDGAHSGDRGASIAVLPFVNMSADKENEYFGDGLAEEVINALAQMPGLQVAGRTSSFVFRGKDIELMEVGRRLNVEHLLEGSVRRAGNRIRVTAQLIKVADGFHLWSERFDRELTDIFAIQDEVTQAIASALRIKLSADSSTTRRHTPNLRAYDIYLKARDVWARSMPGSFAQVKGMLEHAISLDAQFALPYSLLGACYTMLANLGFRPAQECMPLARAAEEEALRVDPALPEAHALLGVCAGGFGHDWIGAEHEWQLAMAREPISRDVRFWYGNHYLLPIGRVAEAVETMARGLQDDPLNLLYRHLYARGLRHLGRLDEAAAELRGVLDVDADFPWALETLGAVCAQQGNDREALALTERAHVVTPWSYTVIGQLAALVDRAGDRKRTDALLEKLGTGEAYGASTGLAIFHAMSGDAEQAAACAARGIAQRFQPLFYMVAPLLKSQPQWAALARLLNLPAA